MGCNAKYNMEERCFNCTIKTSGICPGVFTDNKGNISKNYAKGCILEGNFNEIYENMEACLVPSNYIEICNELAKQSNCFSRKVGALLVQDGKIISKAYNYSIACKDKCIRKNLPSGSRLIDLCTSVHAEWQVINEAGKDAIGADLYVNVTPCFTCVKMIIHSKIKRVIYDEFYPDESGIKMLKDAGIELIKYSDMNK